MSVKKFLISLLEDLTHSVRYNIDNECYNLLMHSPEELEEMLNEADKLMNK